MELVKATLIEEVNYSELPYIILLKIISQIIDQISLAKK
jgi:hypothetical protein